MYTIQGRSIVQISGIFKCTFMVYGHKQGCTLQTHFRNAVPLVWGSFRLAQMQMFHEDWSCAWSMLWGLLPECSVSDPEWRKKKARVATPFRFLVLYTAFIVRFYAACSEHVYSEYFQKNSETIARQGKQATAHMRSRESPTCSRNSRAKAWKSNKGLGALPRLSRAPSPSMNKST